MTKEEINKLLDELPVNEQNEIRKGFELWNNMKVFKEFSYGGRINNETLKELIYNVIINTWINSRKYFNNKKKEHDIYDELRYIGLTHDQCHDVINLIRRMEISCNNC